MFLQGNETLRLQRSLWLTAFERPSSVGLPPFLLNLDKQSTHAAVQASFALNWRNLLQVLLCFRGKQRNLLKTMVLNCVPFSKIQKNTSKCFELFRIHFEFISNSFRTISNCFEFISKSGVPKKPCKV